MITRKQDWDFQLHLFTESRRNVPFAWGANDCCLFVADAILAETGTDIAGKYRGNYNDEKSAAEIIKRLTGGSTVEDVAVTEFGNCGFAELPSVRFAQRGDVVVFDGTLGSAMGLVYLNGVDAVFVSPDGLRRIPVKNCRRAWRVG